MSEIHQILTLLSLLNMGQYIQTYSISIVSSFFSLYIFHSSFSFFMKKKQKAN